MPREGNNVKIPLKTKDAILGLMKVKPTKDMPKAGTTKKAKRKKK